jgi:transcriptional regulator with XRE-family HTH domain
MNVFISQNISYLIRKKGLDNETFGSQFNVSGSSVSTYKTGKATPKIETLIKIASYFDITLDELVLSDLESGLYSTAEHLNASEERIFNDETNYVAKYDTIKQLEHYIELQEKLIVSYEDQIDVLKGLGGGKPFKIVL